MAVFMRGPHWWYRFMIDGKNHRHPCGRHITSRKAAERFESQARRKILAGELNGIRKAPRLCEFGSDFLEFVDDMSENSKLRPNTKIHYHHGVSLLSSSRLWKMRLDRITSEDVDRTAFRDRRKGELLGPSSCNKAIRTLRRIMKMAQSHGLISKIPEFHLYDENEREQIIEEWLEPLLLKQARSPLREAIIFGIDGAMRAGEICAMRWEDVLWADNKVNIPKSKTKKGRRKVGLSTRMRATLQERNDNGSDWVFPSSGDKSGRPARCGHLLPSSIDKMWRKMKARVIREIAERHLPPWPDGLVFHSCRHTGATRYSDAVGNNQFKVQDFVGHADIRTTARYIHHSPDGGLVMDRYRERQSFTAGKLQPCPFCGKNAEMKHLDHEAWWVRCLLCKVSTDTRDNEAEAFAAWNNRVLN